jgi:uncharacterized caspase-like protein
LRGVVKILSTIAVRFLSALILTVWAGSAFADKRVALVVGNSQYARASLKLVNPTNDAQDLAQALKEIGFDVILRTDVGKGNFDQALVDFARKARNADTALVYYAGHGLQRNGKNFFLPTDIDAQDEFDFDFRAISQDSILGAVSQAKNVKVVILDACRDNPLARQFVAFRSWGGGLARIDSAEETVIAYATAPGRVANDGQGRNSPFAAALIKRIKEPGLEITTMFRRVASDVYEKTNGAQQPEITSSLRTDYFLNPAGSDSEAWARVRKSNDPADFKAFIQKFPASPYAPEAQFLIDVFDRIRRENEELKKETDRLALEAEKKRQEEAARKEAERRALEAEKKRQDEAARKEAVRLAVEAERKRLEEEAKKEAERLALEAEKRRQEEAAKLEAERLAFEAEKKRQEEAARQEAERLALAAEKKRQEEAAAKKEAEHLALEAEKRRQEEAAKQEAERLALVAEKKQQAEAAAKLEAERLALEAEKKRQKEAARQEAERIALAVEKKRQEEAAAKKEAERLALEAEKKRQEEAGRLALEAEKKRQEQAAAKKEAERLAQEAEKKRQEEAARQEAERLALAAEKKRQEEAAAKKEGERVALEAEKKRQEEAAKQEAERLAQEAEKKRQEQAAAKKEAERLAQEAERKQKVEEARKEALRIEEEKRAAEERKIAAREEDERRRQEIEQEKQRLARICDGDHNALQELTRTQQTAAIEKLGKETACPTLKPAIETALKEVARAIKHICDSDRKTLAGLKDNDLPSLKSAVEKISCEPVRAEGQQRVAKLEDEQKRIQSICADETTKLHAIDESASTARQQYSEFLARSLCPSTAAQVSLAIKKIDLRVKTAQVELARLGCYTAPITANFDEATKKSLALYHTKKGSLADSDHLTDGLLSELEEQKLGLCPEEKPTTPVMAAPAPEHRTKGHANKEEEEARPERKRNKIEQATREEEEPVSMPPRHKAHSAAREEEPVSEPRKHRTHSAAREEEPAPEPRKHRTHSAAREEKSAPRPHYRAESAFPNPYVRRASPMPMGRAASGGSPTVIGVGN